MDLEELNKQMELFQNDFNTIQSQSIEKKTQQQYQQNINAINFINPLTTPINTTQIKRPMKSGDHRNDINDKLNSLNMFVLNQISNDDISIVSNMIPQHSRNNSNYETLNSNTSSNMTNYYNNNFNTLQSQETNNIISNQHEFTNTPIQRQNSNNNNNNIHKSDLSYVKSFVNPCNIIPQKEINQKIMQQNIIGNVYNKLEEKRIDYRQNMNNKLDNFIFDNPNASSFNSILQSQGHTHKQTKDTRMVIQDSNKDYYRQEANNRLLQYSPLSRASNIPINIANMSVNDFYSNMNSTSHLGTNLPPSTDDKKSIINSRICNIAPLAKTIQYQSNSNSQNQPHQLQSPNQFQKTQQNKISPNNWNDINQTTTNIYNNNLPVMSNK
jgi:hypothetical protein